MKIAVLLSLAVLGWSAPQGKTFQDHFEEFVDICVALEGPHFGRQTNMYRTFPEFQEGLNAIDQPISFKQLYQHFQYLDEFNAIANFLKKYTIDVSYYVDRFETFFAQLNNVEKQNKPRRQRRHPITGRTLYTSIVDTVSMLPRRQLRQLFNEKMAKDELFRNAIEALRSDEFQELYSALWKNRTFRLVAESLAEHDFDLKYIFENVIPAIFGQNIPVYVSFQMLFDEFFDVISALEGPHFIRQETLGYMVYEEFRDALAYLENTSLIAIYSDLIKDPEIKEADNYLRSNDIFVAYYIDRFQLLAHELYKFSTESVAKNGDVHSRQRRHPITGTTMITNIIDTVSMLPIKQLRLMFEDKMKNNAVFRRSIEALKTEEWKKMYEKLWNNEKFKNAVATLTENGFDIKYIMETLAPALFGQNTPIYVSFQNQFDDFLDIIIEEAGDAFLDLVKKYKQFPKFQKSLDYVHETNLIDLYSEFGNISDFSVLDKHFKSHDIFVAYYMDRFGLLVDLINSNVTREPFGDEAYTRSKISGSTMKDFLANVVEILPIGQLNELYQSRIEENKEFKTGVDAVQGEKFEKLYKTFWENDRFKEVVAGFADHDFDFKYVLEVLVPALWGQK